MKICHLTSVHPYTDTRISIKECTSLVKENFEVTLVAPDTCTKEFNNIKIVGVDNPYSSRFKRIVGFSNEILKKAKEIDADLYHFHDPELIPVGLKLLKSGKKVIYDVHEDVPRQIYTKHWIPNFLKGITSKVIEIYENYSVKKFDAIVTATPHIKKRFLSIGCTNVIDVNNYPILNELYQPNNLPKEKKVVYIGKITKVRGIKKMVHAMKKVEGSLTLGGEFPDPHEENDTKEIEGWNKVDFLGYLDREEIREVFSKSIAGLVVLHPTISYLDSLPVKMFEYMGAGIPVIASNFPLWKEIIEGNDCGICVDPLNENEIANAIQWMFDNPEEAARMGENGRKAIESKYNWTIESEKLIKLYEDLSY